MSLIERQAAIDAVESMLRRKFGIGGDLAEITLAELPSAQPNLQPTCNKLETDCISRQGVIDVLSQYPFEKVVNCISIIEEFPSAQPQDIARDIANIIENEKDMRVIAKNAQPEPHWIPCSERLPECEQEVLICTEKKVYVSKKTGMEWYKEPVITPALYEDGTMLEVNSKWRWEDIDYAGWDEEEDCGIIPEGWWENRHFNPDEVYNNVVDQKVIAWMPLPEPYKAESEDK